MKKSAQQLLVISMIIMFLTACSNDVIYKNIAQINYGTSFGECIGYCKHDVIIKSKAATYQCYSWNHSDQILTKDTILNSSVLDSIYSINTTSFFKLPETIGCPDCADGGAEWLEIILLNGKKYKVTFEYHNEPTQLKNQIIKLREILSKNEYR